MDPKPSNVLSSFCEEYMKLYRVWELSSDENDPFNEDWQRMNDHRRACEKCVKPKEEMK